MNYWLMKSEPDVFSIDDLKRMKINHWDGVRNYQARNFMMNDMQLGDMVLFYHSSCEIPGIYGIATVSKLAYPDHTQFDPKSEYYDPKATKEKPRWFMVDVKFSEKFQNPITLTKMREQKNLENFRLLSRGNRLSIIPVEKEYFDILQLLK